MMYDQHINFYTSEVNMTKLALYVRLATVSHVIQSSVAQG